MEVSSIIGEIYDAGSSGDDWSSVGRSMFEILSVDGGTLRVNRPDGSSVNVFEPNAPEETLYSERYGQIDPIRAAASRIVPNGDWYSAVKLNDELVPADTYRRCEFYEDFAKPNGQEHILLGALGDRDRTVLAFFREETPFCDCRKRVLATLLPHFERALQLRRRLREADVTARFGHAAFESLPGGALVVDADLNVLFANTAADRIVSDRDMPLTLSRSLGGAGQLVIRNRKKAAELRRLVADAASGGSGGALRLEVEHDHDDRIDQLAVLVSPQPPQFGGVNEAGRPVLILINELSRPSAPKTALLRDLFGLSLAEGAVAMALLGGQTAETVARERDVSLETVRSQIRTVLRKSDASNLRDFERIGAILATMVH